MTDGLRAYRQPRPSGVTAGRDRHKLRKALRDMGRSEGIASLRRLFGVPAMSLDSKDSEGRRKRIAINVSLTRNGVPLKAEESRNIGQMSDLAAPFNLSNMENQQCSA